MSKFINSFGVQGYRSFGKMQYLSPLSKINLFVGQNNSGKSNILRFLCSFGKTKRETSYKNLIPSDRLNHHQGKSYPMEFALCVDLSDAGITAQLELLRRGKKEINLERDGILSNLLREIGTVTSREEWWFHYSMADGNLRTPTPDDFMLNRSTPKFLTSYQWQRLWSHLTGMGAGSLEAHWIPETLRILSPWARISLPEVHQINEHRKVGLSGESSTDHNGNGIIDRLAELQNPTHDRQNLKENFVKLKGSASIFFNLNLLWRLLCTSKQQKATN